MVKSIFNHSLLASDVVSQRTAIVSEKPHLGAELFPLYSPRADVFPDLENLSFERSIFQRIQGLKLRDSDASGSNLHVLERHWNEDSGREVALDLHRAIAKDIMNPQSFQSELCAIVLPLSRSCLLEKLHLALNHAKLTRTSDNVDLRATVVGGTTRYGNSRTAMKESLEFFRDNLDLDHVLGDKDQGTYQFGIMGKLENQLISDRNHDTFNFENVWKLESCSGDLNGLVLSRILLILIQDINGNYTEGSDNTRCYADILVHSQKFTKGLGSQFQKKYALRFGSAPLWFLQSMATGPPRINSSQPT